MVLNREVGGSVKCGQEWPALQFCLLSLTTKKVGCKCGICGHQVIGGVVCLAFDFFLINAPILQHSLEKSLYLSTPLGMP